MASELARLERLFWNTATGRLDAPAVRRALRAHGMLDAVARMAIYRDMFFARQIEALAQDFPVLAAELGDRPFRVLARDYVLHHPSQAPALEWLGQDLPDYLRERRFDARLIEIAALEWLACAALLAPPDAAASAASIDPAHWPGARLSFARSLQTIAVGRAAYLRYAGLAGHDDGRMLYIALFRRRFGVRHIELPADERAALDCARGGGTFTEICAALPDAARAYEVLRGWFAREWIAAVDVSPC